MTKRKQSKGVVGSGTHTTKRKPAKAKKGGKSDTQDSEYCWLSMHASWLFLKRALTELDAGFELMVWTTATGAPERNVTLVKDISWASVECPYVWEVQGAWPGLGQGVGSAVVPKSTLGSGGNVANAPFFPFSHCSQLPSIPFYFMKWQPAWV